MVDQKNKKKTLTISTGVSKKIDISSLSRDGKKTFSIEKKTSFRSSRDNKSSSGSNTFKKAEPGKKNVVRNFIEQQATKNFIKKEEKSPSKTKLKLKDPDTLDLEKRLTEKLGLNVEISHLLNKGGSIKIKYKNLDQLELITQKLKN